jgi:GDP-4-dehydro-6-deoxy-D-mannose reductase
MRVLITGATGYTGKHLADLALAQGTQVFGVALDGGFASGVTGYLGDLTLPEVADSVLHEVRPDRVYHLAALVPSSTTKVAPDKLLSVNVLGTLRVLEAVSRHAPASRTLIVSSAAVYGPVAAERQPIAEDLPLNPVSPYAASKAMQELLAGPYGATHGLSIMRARAFNLIGPHEQPDLVGATLARQVAEIEASKREPAIQVRYLFTRRDFTDVRDVARAYWHILEYGSAGSVYNVCSGRSHSVGELLETLLSLAGLPSVQVREQQHQLQPGDVALSLGDPSRLKADTSWQPTIPMRQSLSDLLDEWRTRVRALP